MPGIDPLSLPVLALICGIIFFAGLVHGTLGLGFPLVATPCLALITDIRSAILITLLPTIAVNIVSIIKGGHWHLSIAKYWPIAFYVAIGSILGTRLLIVFNDPAPFKLVLAGMILIYLNINRLSAAKLTWVKAYPQQSMLLFGLVAGFLAGMVNVMVPVLVIFFLELGLAPTAMIQIFNLSFLSGKLTQTAVFSHSNILSGEMLRATAPLVIFALVALFIGMAIRGSVSIERYRKWLKNVLFFMAMILIAQYIFT